MASRRPASRLSLPRSSRTVVLVLGLCAAAAPAGADVQLDVSGEVLATQPRLEVRVVITNRGDRPSAAVEVTGELLGQERGARLLAGLAPGQSGSVVLDFDPAAAPPGVHALTLLLEHVLAGMPDAGGNPPLASQRAWLLIALGASPAAAVRVSAAPARIAVRGTLDVAVESADRAAHRVGLRALSARGLRVETAPLELEVPAAGTARARFVLVRAGAPRGSRHGVLLVAESRDGPPSRTTVAVAAVEVPSDESLVPRLHGVLLALALALLAVVIGAELWRVRSRQQQA
jgi:hypothetical protein